MWSSFRHSLASAEGWACAFGFAGIVLMPAAAGCGGSSSSKGNDSSNGTSSSGTDGTSNGESQATGSMTTTTTTAHSSSGGAVSTGSSAASDTNGSAAVGDGGGTGGSTTTVGGAAGAGGDGGGTTMGGSGGALNTGGTTMGGGGGALNTGGTTSGGGNGGSGGTGGFGGTSGAGGSGPTGVVGTLGDACEQPGALACAGNHQKLTLLCGGDGQWEPNQTCGSTEFCDSSEGSNAGVCVEAEEGCAGRDADERFCLDDGLYDCRPDGIHPVLLENCVIECSERASEAICINEVEPCPDPELEAFNCDLACALLENGCGLGVGPIWKIGPVGDVLTFRTGRYEDAADDCNDGNHAFRTYVIQLSPNSAASIRASVAAPWQVSFGSCALEPAGQCMTEEVDSNMNLIVSTDDPNAMGATVTVEHVSQGAMCEE